MDSQKGVRTHSSESILPVLSRVKELYRDWDRDQNGDGEKGGEEEEAEEEVEEAQEDPYEGEANDEAATAVEGELAMEDAENAGAEQEIEEERRENEPEGGGFGAKVDSPKLLVLFF